VTKESSQDKGQWPGPFPSHWASASFAESFDNVTSSRLKLAQKKYEEAGVLPVIDQGAEPVGGYTNDESLRHPGPLPSIIFGDHTRCVKFIERPFVQGADGVKVLAPRLFEPRFSFWALKTLQLPDRGYARHFKFLKASRFPVPPINEQRRIVAKIEDLTARSRAAKQALDAIPPLLERFRQSVLAAAFRGDLTKQWRQQNPNTEPASELLKRIRQERRHRWEQDYLEKQKDKGRQPKNDKWKEKYKEPEPVDSTDLPELPEGWCWATIDLLAEKVQDGNYGGSYPKKNEWQSSGVPFLTAACLATDGTIKDSAVKFVSQEKQAELQKAQLALGDVIFPNRGSRDAQLFGAQPFAIRVPDEFIPGNINPQLTLVRPLKEVMTSRFFSWALNAPTFLLQVRAQTTGSALNFINLTQTKRMFIPVPPLDEQNEIAEIVESYIQNLESRFNIDGLVSLVGKLNQSILAKAFRGELVPQDPNDEPASALLDRIRAEQEQEAPKKKRKKAKA